MDKGIMVSSVCHWLFLFETSADVTLFDEQVDGEMHNEGEDVSKGVGKVLH